MLPRPLHELDELLTDIVLLGIQSQSQSVGIGAKPQKTAMNTIRPSAITQKDQPLLASCLGSVM